MSSKGFRERILEILTDGPALVSSSTATSLLDADDKEAFLGPTDFEVGFVIAFLFSGRMSTVVTTPGTLTLALRAGSTDIFNSGAMSLNIVAKTDVHWSLSGELVCRARGLTTTTTFFPKGCRFESHAVIGAAVPTVGGAGAHLLPYNTAPAVGTGIDFTASHQLDLYGTHSVNGASTSIQVHAGHIDIYRRT